MCTRIYITYKIANNKDIINKQDLLNKQLEQTTTKDKYMPSPITHELHIPTPKTAPQCMLSHYL